MTTNQNPFDQISRQLNSIENNIDDLKNLLKKKQAAPQVEKEIIFMADVCYLTNLAKQTIYQLVHKAEIPVIKPEGVKKLMFRKTDIMLWLDCGMNMSEFLKRVSE